MTATFTIEGIGYDIAVPDPTDVVPYKWIGYGIIATVSAGIIYSYGRDAMVQYGNNNGKLEPEEVEAIEERIANGTVSRADKQKYEKSTKQKHSRRSKDRN